MPSTPPHDQRTHKMPMNPDTTRRDVVKGVGLGLLGGVLGIKLPSLGRGGGGGEAWAMAERTQQERQFELFKKYVLGSSSNSSSSSSKDEDSDSDSEDEGIGSDSDSDDDATDSDSDDGEW